MAVACLQGIINRQAPRLYVLSPKDSTRPQYGSTFSTRQADGSKARKRRAGARPRRPGRSSPATAQRRGDLGPRRARQRQRGHDHRRRRGRRRAQPGAGRPLSASVEAPGARTTCAGGSPAPRPAARRTTPTAGPSGSTWPRAVARRTCFACSRMPSRPARRGDIGYVRHARLGREEPGFRVRPFAVGRREAAATTRRSGSAWTWRPTS